MRSGVLPPAGDGPGGGGRWAGGRPACAAPPPPARVSACREGGPASLGGSGAAEAAAWGPPLRVGPGGRSRTAGPGPGAPGRRPPPSRGRARPLRPSLTRPPSACPSRRRRVAGTAGRGGRCRSVGLSAGRGAGSVGQSVCRSVCLSVRRREERRALPARRCVCRARALPSTTRPTRSGAERWVRSSGTGTSRPGAATPSPERRRGAGRSAAARPPVRACGGSAGSRAGGPGGRAGPGQARPGRAGGTAVGSRGQGGTGEGSAVTGTASGDKSDVGPGQRPAGDLTRWSAVDAASVGRRSRGERRVRGQPLSREGRETATGKRLPPPPPRQAKKAAAAVAGSSRPYFLGEKQRR